MFCEQISYWNLKVQAEHFLPWLKIGVCRIGFSFIEHDILTPPQPTKKQHIHKIQNICQEEKSYLCLRKG